MPQWGYRIGMTNTQHELFLKARDAASNYANALRSIACKFPADPTVLRAIDEAVALLERSKFWLHEAHVLPLLKGIQPRD
jgi:hypothetical protein